MNKKSEIHARLPSQLMEDLKQICETKGCNLSDVSRSALDLYRNLYRMNDLMLAARHKLRKVNAIDIAPIPPECDADPEPSDAQNTLLLEFFNQTLPGFSVYQELDGKYTWYYGLESILVSESLETIEDVIRHFLSHLAQIAVEYQSEKLKQRHEIRNLNSEGKILKDGIPPIQNTQVSNLMELSTDAPSSEDTTPFIDW